ncbi:hypothetical protein PanWU01x14_082220 [Parasponia andersonii]|uniref:Transmembrane protein n=1 Tax=Parasponia andersonii TaxID=3476 RepID=A0A2P5DAI3_PARAD|nr:hypothetical protein PanWU01x14_082220 [Parasponia andersonii]
MIGSNETYITSNLEFLDHPPNDISYAKYDIVLLVVMLAFLVVDLLAKIMILLKRTSTSSLVLIWSFFVLSTICRLLTIEVRSNSSGDAFFYHGSVDC